MEEVVIDFGDASTQVFHVGAGVRRRAGARRGARRGARGATGGLPWAELFEPALDLARAGVEMTGPQRFLLEILVPILERTDEGRRIYGSHSRAETAAMVPGSSACATAARPRSPSSSPISPPTSPRTG